MSDEKGNSIKAGLYLCATPIGNIGDITDRVRKVLNSADIIFCEDTRNSRILLDKLGIKKPLESCHEHNEEQSASRIITLISNGSIVAYISDAGMPGISDPGERLIRACADSGLYFTALPGASASITAAILSGLSTKRLYFAGFLPRENKERQELIAEIKKVRATIILYESPYRVSATLAELRRALGERQAAIVREITKLYEETIRGTLSDLSEKYKDAPPKGECVIVISGEPMSSEDGEKEGEGLDDMLKRLLSSGMSVKDAAKQTALILDIPKNEAYARANELKSRE